MQPLGSKLSDETTDDTESFLPDSAESTEVVRTLDEEFASGETTQGIIVYRHEGGLTPPTSRGSARTRRRSRALPTTRSLSAPRGSRRSRSSPDSPPGLVSEDGEVAYTVLTVPTDDDFEKQGEGAWPLATSSRRSQPTTACRAC